MIINENISIIFLSKFLPFVFSFLFLGGLFFILIEMATKFEKSLLYAGYLLVLFSLIIAFSFWVNPNNQTPDQKLSLIRAYYSLACLTFPIIFQYFMKVTNNNNVKLSQFTVFLTTICIISNYSDYFICNTNGVVTVGTLNKLLYSLLGIFTLVVPVLMLRKAIKHSMGEVKKMLQMHLVGIFLLAVPATFAASLGITNPCIQSAISKNLILIFGFPFFGIVITLVFIQRFILLIKDRQVAFEKLETAYTELDQANSLKEIGQSTAIINHEIKNFTFGISGNVQLILDYDKFISEPTRNKLTAIIETTKRMSDFSMDILELSKAKILKEKVEISVYGVMQRCIENHFAQKKCFFSFDGFEQDPLIHGDWNKLDHVFVNVFKNAFEAEATLIQIKAIKSPTVLLLTIDDDGIGCDEKAFKHLFTAFYTTKKNSRGTGLGMPIIKSIVESHGGYISAYSKNLMEGGDHGLVLNVSFPTYSQPNTQTDIPKQNIVLVKEGIENIGPVIRVFQNVHFTPRIVQSLSDMDGREFSLGKMMVLANPENIVKLQKRSENFRAYALMAGNDKQPTVMNVSREGPPEAFSEEFVIANFVMVDREAA